MQQSIRPTIKSTLLAALLAVLTGSVFSAVQSDKQATVTPVKEVDKTEIVKSGSEAKAADPIPAKKTDSQGRFIPSESISEDLAVSFPIDI